VKYLRFVPSVLEKEVDKYFVHFEKNSDKVWLDPMNNLNYFYRVSRQGKPKK
jgi:hypothetical protein